MHCRPGAFLCSWFLGVYSALLLCWLPLLGACSRRCGSCRPPEVSFGLLLFLCVGFFLVPVAGFSHHGLEVLTSSCVWRASLGIGMECATRCVRSLCAGCRGVFSTSWVVAWLCSLVALPLFCVPAGSRSVVGCTLLCSSAGCRCWAFFRRCGSCRPPEVSFCLRSFWCVRFFLVLGCFLRFWTRLFACRSLLVFLPRSGGIDLILCLVGQTLAWSALLAACVSYVLSVVVCFLHPWFCGVVFFDGGPVPHYSRVPARFSVCYRVHSALLWGRWGPGGGLGGGLGGLGAGGGAGPAGVAGSVVFFGGAGGTRSVLPGS